MSERMQSPPSFLQAGHLPTLLSSFLFFNFSFAIWAINGAMAPFLADSLHLSPQQIALLGTLPTMAGAFLRFPFGILAQVWGRKHTALLMMGCLLATLLYGYAFANTYRRVMVVGFLLGIAGANFSVALALGAGWYPPGRKGFVMGIIGSGNAGTALAALFAPMVAIRAGWQTVYGLAALVLLLPFVVTLLSAKEPPDRAGANNFSERLQCLWQWDCWALIGFYTITFGGYVGFSAFLASYYPERFQFTKIETTYVLALGALTAGCFRMLGGYFADRLDGITMLLVAYVGLIGGFVALSVADSAPVTTVAAGICFAAFGWGNGAIFQLVPLRWPSTAAVAGGAIGGVGAMGAAILPLTMGYSRTLTGDYRDGFIVFAALVSSVLIALRLIGRRWVHEWVGPGGRASGSASSHAPSPPVSSRSVTTPSPTTSTPASTQR